MKPATQILAVLATATGGYLVWALHKRTKELIYALVKAKYALIILVVAAIAAFEVFGWGRIKEFLFAAGYVIAWIAGGIIGIILCIAGIAWVVQYARTRAVLSQQPQPTAESEQDPS